MMFFAPRFVSWHAAFLALGIFAAAPFAAPVAAQAPCCLEARGTTDLQIETIAGGLQRPWALGFLPDGSQLVTERPGRLRRIVDGQIGAPIAGLPADLRAQGQGGLLDILVHPAFAQNGLVFFTYSQAGQGGLGTAVARARLNLAANALEEVTPIFTMADKSRGGRHFGSRLALAGDGTVFITLGDRGQPRRAQDPFDHAGKVLRITQDGQIPADNPFADGVAALPEIWSLGHRNAQGAAYDARAGALRTLAHGAAGGDEINQPLAGRNYGWPRISYGRNYNGTGFADGQAAEGLEQPMYYWDPSIAPSGLALYDPPTPLIPDWRGSLLVGALRGEHLGVLRLEDGRITQSQVYLQGQVGRIRDVRTGPDGAVWVLTDADQGQLLRLTQP